MKKSFPLQNSCRSGFTLVELLVVIGIIAILATAVIGGASAAINSAKRLKVQNTASQIQTAVINYYTEYSVYPIVNASTTDVLYGSHDTNWRNLTYALCGNINPYNSSVAATGLNSRNIAFLSPTKSDLDNNGVPRNSFTTAANAEYFYIAMDADYSNITGDSGGVAGQMPDFVKSQGQTTLSFTQNGVPQGVCVWSNSQDTPYPGATTIHPQFWAHTY